MRDPARIILTRERNRNLSWSERLTAAGLAWLAMPLVRYAPLPVPAELDLTGFDWVLLTSPQGVRAFTAMRPDIGAARCAVLGHGTARALQTAGWPIDFNAGALDGAEFVQGFLSVAAGPGPVLLPGPKRRLVEPRAALEKAGYTVQELPLYETLPTDTARISGVSLGPDDVVFFCSPSAVRAFSAARTDKPKCVAIGRTTAEACRAVGLTPLTADTPDLDSMVKAAGFTSLPNLENEPVKPELES